MAWDHALILLHAPKKTAYPATMRFSLLTLVAAVTALRCCSKWPVCVLVVGNMSDKAIDYFYAKS